MKDLAGKISTKAGIKLHLKKWAQEKEEFTTKQAMAGLPEKAHRVFMNGNKLGQYLRNVDTHEYHKSIKRWVRIR